MVDVDVITLSDDQIDKLLAVASCIWSCLEKNQVPQLVGQIREYCIGITLLEFSLLIYFLVFTDLQIKVSYLLCLLAGTEVRRSEYCVAIIGRSELLFNYYFYLLLL